MRLLSRFTRELFGKKRATPQPEKTDDRLSTPRRSSGSKRGPPSSFTPEPQNNLDGKETTLQVANPIPVFAAMIEDVCNMRENGPDTEDEVVCLILLQAPPDEYSVFRQFLERQRNKHTINRVRAEL